MPDEHKIDFSLPPPEVADKPGDAPAIFADSLWHASTLNDVVRLTFVKTLGVPLDSPDPGWKGYHAATIFMPVQQFHHMLSYLNRAQEEWVSKGVIRAPDKE